MSGAVVFFGFSGTHSSRAFSRLSNPPASSGWWFSQAALRSSGLVEVILTSASAPVGGGRDPAARSRLDSETLIVRLDHPSRSPRPGSLVASLARSLAPPPDADRVSERVPVEEDVSSYNA